MSAEFTAAFGRGDTAAALEFARAQVAEQPLNPDAHLALLNALRRAGDFAAAKMAIEEAIRQHPEHPELHMHRAALALDGGDLERAEGYVRDALALDPNLLSAYTSLVHIALVQGRPDDAARELKLAQRVDPDHPQVKTAEGQWLLHSGETERALTALTEAIERAPDYALAQTSIGLAYLKNGNLAFAEQALRNALALGGPNTGVFRALVEVCRRQNKLGEAIDVLGMALELRDDLAQRTLRGQLAVATGQWDRALADFLQVLERMPTHEAVLGVSVDLLLRQGRVEDAVALVERALSHESREPLWVLRAALPVRSLEEQAAILERWSAAMPESGLCLDQQARLQDRLGNAAAAQSLARRALALNPGLADSALLLLRHELLTDPEAALNRAMSMLQASPAPEVGREIERLRGLALDRLGRHAEATAAWESMRQVRVAPNRIPEPLAAGVAAEGEAAGILLWSPPGTPLERLMPMLAESLSGRLLLDRFGPDGGREDGFAGRQVPGGLQPTGTAKRWQEALVARGLNPAEVVDVLPHFDAYTASALPGARVVAVLADPRDTLLGWLVFGNAQGYAFPPDARNAAAWLAACLEALADHRDAHPEAVSVVAIDAFDGDAGAVLSTLQSALGVAGSAMDRSGGSPAIGEGASLRFAPGHWRHYSALFAGPFAMLQTVAQRLGYPAE